MVKRISFYAIVVGILLCLHFASAEECSECDLECDPCLNAEPPCNEDEVPADNMPTILLDL